ncbi:uncharacterized protein BP5553_07191 [Venustampulla echinocandica]|uniref:Uncharacterized protein n=1 Tax=Venustampulla echinocandica TaxID=2656787 RepID=A0A370TIU4_9HELO|nr:uncharacterized protein BP5553_07191 [Venustampulla echinocandica]RDL35260.1 hypothetical protein BP5553_07191 [Venustampulla echinocandica]
MSFTTSSSQLTLFGRGGYNGPKDDEEDSFLPTAPLTLNMGRGGYNRGAGDDEEEDGREREIPEATQRPPLRVSIPAFPALASKSTLASKSAFLGAPCIAYFLSSTAQDASKGSHDPT